MGQAEDFVEKNAEVIHFMVVDAKAFFLKKMQSAEMFETQILMDQFLDAVDAQLPKEIYTGNEYEPEESQLKQIATSISWIQASSEAIWKMINASIILPCQELWRRQASVTCKYNRGGHGMNFDKLMIFVPGKVTLSPSYRRSKSALLADADLFLREINIPGINSEVELALRESVDCFQAELYTATMAMLGKASEGSWLDLGASLIQALPSDRQEGISKKLDNPNLSITGKIQTVLDVFRSLPAAQALSKGCGISLVNLQQVALWSDVVRDSRNTIHFGVASAMPNTYEKVGTLLIAAVSYLRMLYTLKGKCNELAAPDRLA